MSHTCATKPRGWLLAGVAAALLAFGSERAVGQAEYQVPPSWGDDGKIGYPDSRPKRRQRKERPWYEPRAALGLGLNFPELVPFEGYLFFGRYFALRGFYTPAMPFRIRVEMPSDVISTKKQVGVANPDFTIKFKALYGPQYGLEALVFPLGGSFFVSAGASYRKMRLTGETRSAVLVCSLIEAAKEPPCPDPEARIQTQSELELAADAVSSAILARAALGWFWHVGSGSYFSLAFGATKPISMTRRVDVTANIDAPGNDDEDLTGALAQLKVEKEAELEEKALAEMRPVEEKLLPIAGLAFGIRF